MSRRGPYWKNETTWICPNHLPSVKIPANVECCFYVNCTSKRPERLSTEELQTSMAAATNRTSRRPTKSSVAARKTPRKIKKQTRTINPASAPVPAAAVPTDEPLYNALGQRLCAWFKCDKGENGGRAVARSRSKYCSRDCSNRNARWRHKNR